MYPYCIVIPPCQFYFGVHGTRRHRVFLCASVFAARPDAISPVSAPSPSMTANPHTRKQSSNCTVAYSATIQPLRRCVLVLRSVRRTLLRPKLKIMATRTCRRRQASHLAAAPPRYSQTSTRRCRTQGHVRHHRAPHTTLLVAPPTGGCRLVRSHLPPLPDPPAPSNPPSPFRPTSPLWGFSRYPR